MEAVKEILTPQQKVDRINFLEIYKKMKDYKVRNKDVADYLDMAGVRNTQGKAYTESTIQKLFNQKGFSNLLRIKAVEAVEHIFKKRDIPHTNYL